jgi:hypothetical protein
MTQQQYLECLFANFKAQVEDYKTLRQQLAIVTSRCEYMRKFLGLLREQIELEKQIADGRFHKVRGEAV